MDLKKSINLKNISAISQIKNIYFPSAVSESIDDFNSKGNRLIEKLNLAADLKKSICIFDEFNRMALDAIAKVFIYLLIFKLFYHKKI